MSYFPRKNAARAYTSPHAVQIAEMARKIEIYKTLAIRFAKRALKAESESAKGLGDV